MDQEDNDKGKDKEEVDRMVRYLRRAMEGDIALIEAFAKGLHMMMMMIIQLEVAPVGLSRSRFVTMRSRA